MNGAGKLGGFDLNTVVGTSNVWVEVDKSAREGASY